MSEEKKLDIQELNITKAHWAIVRHGDPKGYHTGTPKVSVDLIQDDSAKIVCDTLAEGSVTAGESMGDYLFQVLATSPNLYDYAEREEQEDLEYEEGDPDE